MICLDVIVRINGIRIFEIMERPGKPLVVYSIMIRLELNFGPEMNFYFIKHSLL